MRNIAQRHGIIINFTVMARKDAGTVRFGGQLKIALAIKTIRLCICVEFNTPSQCIWSGQYGPDR